MVTVKELINELTKYPPDSFVGVRAHDNKENEVQGIVDSVEEFDPVLSFDPEYCKNVHVVLDI